MCASDDCLGTETACPSLNYRADHHRSLVFRGLYVVVQLTCTTTETWKYKITKLLKHALIGITLASWVVMNKKNLVSRATCTP